jgi:ABC-type protease/lipase transport system fused ATPase/permease subunit
MMTGVDITKLMPDSNVIKELYISKELNCNDHSRELTKLSKNTRFAFYLVLMGVGSYVAFSAVINQFF